MSQAAILLLLNKEILMQLRQHNQKRRRNWLLQQKNLYLYLAIIFWLVCSCAGIAQDLSSHLQVDAINPLHNIWMLVAGALVFFMNAEFALLEAGFCRQKSLINVLAKNLIVFCVSMLAFWSLGFGLMFGDGNLWVGTKGFFFQPLEILKDNLYPLSFTNLQKDYTTQSFAAVFFFQLVFAGTSATIVSGAVDERVKFWAFFCFSFILVGILYPITGHWVWGNEGWLRTMGFIDFAGSTVVHSVGGMAALMGAILLGPRLGRFNKRPQNKRQYMKRKKAFVSANLGFATLGCFILWLGWIGFNGGSVGSNLGCASCYHNHYDGRMYRRSCSRNI